MLRATRHRKIIDLVRRSRRPITAQSIADRLEVTVRTVYRDVAALIGDGVPIRGEAGVGYVMAQGYDLPPLMFTPDELEALMLGARMVAARADEETARAADEVIAKVTAAIPTELQPVLVEAPLYAVPIRRRERDRVGLRVLREALRAERKVRVRYVDEKGEETERIIWPLSIGYFDHRRLVVAWCELRDDFRHFRTDRINSIELLDERLPRRRQALLADWRVYQAARCEAERAARESGEPDPCA
jgi:predicted DNA-binding transcriptional regulator YafY